MVIGRGKNKKSFDYETTIREEKEIKLDEINSKVEEMQNLRKKSIVAESKTFREKIEYKLYEISKIIKELERDKVWRKVSNIVGLPEWLIDVKKNSISFKNKTWSRYNSKHYI